MSGNDNKAAGEGATPEDKRQGDVPGHDGNASNAPNDSQQEADGISSSGRHTNFSSASPESNVNPPGAPQSSHGSATRPIPGGTEGKADGQDTGAGIGGSAGGGAGTPA